MTPISDEQLDECRRKLERYANERSGEIRTPYDIMVVLVDEVISLRARVAELEGK